MGAIAIPILPDQVDAWKKFAQALKGEKAAEFADHNRRHGLTRHAAWLQQTPDGGHLVVAFHEGPGEDKFLANVAGSTHPFDVWFREQIGAAHGIDFSQPPPPLPENWINWRG